MAKTVSFLLFLLVVAVPLVGAQSAPDPRNPAVVEQILSQDGQEITFYGHIFGFGRGLPMPMNTQFPVGEADYSIGTSSNCGNAPPLPASNEACRTYASNEQLWYSTAGFVQVKTAEQWGGNYALFHNERGLTKDIYLDTSQKASALYHMSADFHGWLVLLCAAACWNWDPGYLPDWTVEAWVWHANLGELHSSPSDPPNLAAVTAREEGVVAVAHGKSNATDMMSFDATVPVVGGRTVWPFPFDLDWDPEFVASGGRIPKEDNLIVEWEWYEETANPAGGMNRYIVGTGVAGIVWNLNGGEDYPSHIKLPVRNPIDVELVYPQFIHDKLVIVSVINTPWGSYDIDPELIKLIVKDESGAVIVPKDGTMARVLEQSVAHSGHYQPIKPTWVWDYKEQDLAKGDYTVEVEVTNFQHSVTTSTAASFTIADDGTGTAREGRSGISTLQAGSLHAGHKGTVADPNATLDPAAAGSDGSGKGAPGPLLPMLAIGLAATAAWRRRK